MQHVQRRSDRESACSLDVGDCSALSRSSVSADRFLSVSCAAVLACLGAVSVITGVGFVGTQVKVSFVRDSFESNLNVVAGLDPTSVEAYSNGNNFGRSDTTHTVVATLTLCETGRWCPGSDHSRFALFCFAVCLFSCLSISETDTYTSSYPTLLTAAEVTISACSFKSSMARFGGCVFIGIVDSLAITSTTWDHCTGFWGGSLYLWTPTYHIPLAFAQLGPFTVSGSSVSHGMARGIDSVLGAARGGGFLLVSLLVVVLLEEVQVSDTSALGSGGAVHISSCTQQVIVNSCRFIDVGAQQGGAFSVDATPQVSFADAIFSNVHATSRGGALTHRELATVAWRGLLRLICSALLLFCFSFVFACVRSGAIVSTNCHVHFEVSSFDNVFLQQADAELDDTKVNGRCETSVPCH